MHKIFKHLREIITTAYNISKQNILMERETKQEKRMQGNMEKSSAIIIKGLHKEIIKVISQINLTSSCDLLGLLSNKSKCII